MSGRVQKDSADDSDRVDDAVDPRVQVSAAARVCVARTVPLSAYPSSSTSSSRFAILTLSSSARRETSRQRLNRAGRSRVVRRGSNGEFRTPGPIFLRERLLLSPPPSAHARTHTRTNHKTSPFLNPPPPSLLSPPPGRDGLPSITATARAKLPSLPGNSVSTREIGAQCFVGLL